MPNAVLKMTVFVQHVTAYYACACIRTAAAAARTSYLACGGCTTWPDGRPGCVGDARTPVGAARSGWRTTCRRCRTRASGDLDRRTRLRSRTSPRRRAARGTRGRSDTARSCTGLKHANGTR